MKKKEHPGRMPHANNRNCSICQRFSERMQLLTIVVACIVTNYYAIYLKKG